jgi:hypothetical protein
MPRTIYRIVWTNPPSDDDYLTYFDKGVDFQTDDPEIIKMSQGLSVLVTLQRARRQGKGRPWQGNAFIAIYELPDDNTVVLEQTGRHSWHYTVWCDPAILRSCLRDVIPIREGDEHV